MTLRSIVVQRSSQSGYPKTDMKRNGDCDDGEVDKLGKVLRCTHGGSGESTVANARQMCICSRRKRLVAASLLPETLSALCSRVPNQGSIRNEKGKRMEKTLSEEMVVS
jgi:hypothetical protein